MTELAEGGLRPPPQGKTAARRRVDGFVPQVYDELRSLAARYLRKESSRGTLQPTALVHEAYVRLAKVDRIDWKGKTHFLAVASTEMRRVLVEHARAASTRKRGERSHRITLDDKLLPAFDRTVELLVLDESLERLARRSSRQARVAELRVFSGLRNREIAGVLGVSERTVKGDWQMAKAWLARELKQGGTRVPS